MSKCTCLVLGQTVDLVGELSDSLTVEIGGKPVAVLDCVDLDLYTSSVCRDQWPLIDHLELVVRHWRHQKTGVANARA